MADMGGVTVDDCLDSICCNNIPRPTGREMGGDIGGVAEGIAKQLRRYNCHYRSKKITTLPFESSGVFLISDAVLVEDGLFDIGFV